jgi:hypothetical protein
VSWVRKVDLPIPGSWMLTGEGPRRADCLHETTCTDAAAKRPGDAHCPEGCSAWEAPSRVERDAARDHLATSRRHVSAALGGGGWRAPGTGGGDR